MKELNEKILKNFRDNIAISNLKEEFIMKKAIKKQIITLSMIGIVFLSGGFLTVNAATNGELVNKVQDTIKVMFVKDDAKEEQVKGTTYTDSNNHTVEKFEINDNGAEYTLEVDRTTVDESNIVVNETIKDNEASIVIDIKK